MLNSMFSECIPYLHDRGAAAYINAKDTHIIAHLRMLKQNLPHIYFEISNIIPCINAMVFTPKQSTASLNTLSVLRRICPADGTALMMDEHIPA